MGDNRSNKGKWIALLAILAVVFAAGGALWFLNPPDEVVSDQAFSNPERTESQGADAPDPAASEPMLVGQYTGFYMDQDISITIIGDSPKPLSEVEGVARYSNVVTGQSCVSRLQAVVEEVVGGVVDKAVLFNQRPVPGEPECSQSIPVKIDISDQQRGARSVVNVMSVEWLSPSGGEVLMQGDLTRKAK